MTVSLKDKFVGCVMGALVGDCYGFPFEFSSSGPTKVATFLNERLTENTSDKESELIYTDDTEMSRSVAESLLACKGFDARDMAKRFVDEYFRSPELTARRSYGSHVRTVFQKVKKILESGAGDVYGPASEQFGGKGSLGNGAAMRTHPVALFCHGKDLDTMFQICRETARLTHTNIDGYNGAILQTLAVRQALEADPGSLLDVLDFVKRLRTTMAELESKRPKNEHFPSFSEQLDLVKSSLKDQKTHSVELGIKLGTDETANFSVATAIFCFLRSQQPLEDFPTDNPFLRALYLSLSLGGDTDTVGTMCCALSGAFHGRPAVPEVLWRQCESWKQVLDLADRLAALAP